MPQLFYQLPTSTGGTGVVDIACECSSPVGRLKDQLARQLGVPSARLACYRPNGGAALPDSFDLRCLGNEEDDEEAPELGNGVIGCLRVSWLLSGGKTHGQIGKAGKVRRQTPQVEKAAGKPKDKTGRARKRQLFNRRFGGPEVGQQQQDNAQNAASLR